MNSIKNVITLLALLWAIFYGMEYLTLWWNPAPVASVAAPKERVSRIIVGGTGGRPDQVVWERKDQS